MVHISWDGLPIGGVGLLVQQIQRRVPPDEREDTVCTFRYPCLPPGRPEHRIVAAHGNHQEATRPDCRGKPVDGSKHAATAVHEFQDVHGKDHVVRAQACFPDVQFHDADVAHPLKAPCHPLTGHRRDVARHERAGVSRDLFRSQTLCAAGLQDVAPIRSPGHGDQLEHPSPTVPVRARAEIPFMLEVGPIIHRHRIGQILLSDDLHQVAGLKVETAQRWPPTKHSLHASFRSNRNTCVSV